MTSTREKRYTDPRLLARARSMLLTVTDVLERAGVPYHLEGGTLLGIVRDGDLLPWDNDMDLSVESVHLDRLKGALPRLVLAGLRVSRRRFTTDHPMWKRGAIRMIKVRRRKLLVLRGTPCLDVLIKYRHQGYVYWEAADKVMRVPEDVYDGHAGVPFQGHVLRAPKQYERYLELKYGDWRTPVKEWNCAVDEKTVVGDV